MVSCADCTVMDVSEVNDTKLKGRWLTRPGNLSRELIAWSDSQQWMHIEYRRHIVLCHLTSQLCNQDSCGMWDRLCSKGNTQSFVIYFSALFSICPESSSFFSFPSPYHSIIRPLITGCIYLNLFHDFGTRSPRHVINSSELCGMGKLDALCDDLN